MIRKRKRIAVFLAEPEENYQEQLWNSISDYAQKIDIDVVIFVVVTANIQNRYRFNFSVIKQLFNVNDFDGVIVLAGALFGHQKKNEIIQFFNEITSIPKVSISIQLEGMYNVLIDNRTGITEILSHLIVHHQRRKIAFIKGPDDNQEAVERYNEYLNTLKEYNIPLDLDLVLNGEFEEHSGYMGVKILLDKRKVTFNALMGADDNIAIGAIAALKERGIKVPIDVAVVGFDNIDEAQFVSPPLTTILQPLLEQGRKAVDIIINIIDGLEVEQNSYLPTKAVFRESCGCIAKSVMLLKNGLDNRLINETSVKIKELIFNGIMHEFNLIDQELSENYGSIIKIIDLLLENKFDENTEESLLIFLHEALSECLDSEKDISVLDRALEIIRYNFFKFIYDQNNKLLYDHMFQNAIIMISDFKIRSHANEKKRITESHGIITDVTESLTFTYDIEELMDNLHQKIANLKIPCCYIGLYDSLYNNTENNAEFIVPEYSKMIMVFDNSDSGIKKYRNTVFNTNNLLPDIVRQNKTSFVHIVMTLHYNIEQLGFVVFERGNEQTIIYENIRAHVSSAIKNSLLFKQRKAVEDQLKVALKQLEVMNESLRKISIQDELTGLYNRRGFYEFGEKQYQVSKRLGNDLLFMFIDLDRLKYINDTYGHDEGDRAIVLTANILRKSFRQIDIIARLGGDEFVVLAINVKQNDFDAIKQRIHENIECCNNEFNKQYHISMSIGDAFFESGCTYTLFEMMEIADKNLYKEKQRKKAENPELYIR